MAAGPRSVMIDAPPQDPRFLRLAEALPGCAFQLDGRGRIVFMAERAREMFGVPGAELPGRAFDTLLHPADRELALRALASPGADGPGPRQVDLRLLRRTGVPFFGRLRFVADGDGVTGVITDLTLEDEDANRLQTYRNYQDRGLSLLYLFSVNLGRLPPGENLFRFIARGLRTFTSARFVTLSEYDAPAAVLRHRYYEVDAGVLGRVVSMLGTRVEDLETPISPEKVRDVMVRGWIRSDSLYDLAFGSVPRPVASAIQKFLGVDRFFAISFVFGDTLYGTSLIALTPGEPDPPLELLQAFRHTIALALRCRALEAARG